MQERKWLARFRSGNFDVKNEPRFGWPITEKSDEIIEKIEQDQHISSHDIAYELNIHHQTVSNHLQRAGLKKKLDFWVSHELSVKKQDRPTHTRIFDDSPKMLMHPPYRFEHEIN